MKWADANNFEQDALIPWLQAATSAVSHRPTLPAPERGALADLMAGIGKHATEAIQVWQDFENTEPLHARGADERIENWLGAVRYARLQRLARQVEAVVAAVASAIKTAVPAFDAAGVRTAQAELVAGASPQDAARYTIRLLSARMIQARAVTQTIEATSTTV